MSNEKIQSLAAVLVTAIYDDIREEIRKKVKNVETKSEPKPEKFEMKYIPLTRADLLEKHGIPISIATLRQWHATAKNKELFVKLERRIYLKYDEWLKYVERNHQENMKRKSADDYVKAVA